MNPIPVVAEIDVNARQEHAFEKIVPIDLTLIFTGHLGLPAVTGTQDETGAWAAAGQSRTVCLSDGSQAQEHLDDYHHPETFSYTVSGFTGSLRFLARFAKGQWWFEQKGEDMTRVRWQYAFTPTSVLAWPLMWLIARFVWSGYMRKAIRLCKEHVEAG